jgi:hypothetical protein
MTLGKGIVIHATEEARKKWEERGCIIKKRKSGCPSCEIEELKKKKDYNMKGKIK